MSQITWRDKSVRTPQGLLLEIPHPALAKQVQAEWDKTDKPDPKTMHYTSCAMSVLDIIASKRDIITSDISNYIHADVIYYFADSDDELITHQHKIWDEWKAWAETKLQTQAKTTSGITPLEQSHEYYTSAMAIITETSDWHFYALQNFITACHSWVLGTAIYFGDLTPEQAIHLSHGDALYQEQHWGADTQATSERQALIAELGRLQNYLHLLSN